MNKAENFINQKLAERKLIGTYRQLRPDSTLIDFCSNDYLGFARSGQLRDAIHQYLNEHYSHLNGATGSRLLSGNSNFCEELEAEIAAYHGAEAGLIFNSGYDANLGLFSSLPQRGDTVITDELIHACIIDGARLSYANRYIFAHNDLDSLEAKLRVSNGNIYIAVESVYSMDGDFAPLAEMAALAKKYDAMLIVDEAHATGVFGSGLVAQFNLQNEVFAAVVTFGKALGTHGAVVLGSSALRDYLINFARSFIYTTAAPFSALVAVKMAYTLLKQSDALQQQLTNNIALFKSGYKGHTIASESAIQSLVVGGNEQTRAMATQIQEAGFDIRPILSPTVKQGTERLRICLHAFNTTEQITHLVRLLNSYAR